MTKHKGKIFPAPISMIGGAPQHQMPFDVTQAQPKGCLGCGSELFNLAYRIGLISAIAPGNRTGKDVTVKYETFICQNCSLEFGQKPERMPFKKRLKIAWKIVRGVRK